MNPQRLYLKDGTETQVWYCGKCTAVYNHEFRAEQCCQNYKCIDCGKDTGGRSWTMCDACREARRQKEERERFEKAEKVTEWTGWVYDGSEYHDSIDAYLDSCVCNDVKPHEYLWTCDPHQFVRADVDRLLEYDDAPEDFETSELIGLDELYKAAAAFEEANKDKISYEPNYHKAVLIGGEK